MLTIEERIKAIENSNSLTDLSSDVLPKSHQEDYYFVSYSHKDYKAVLTDILKLEAKGLNFWYDTDIHVGENWEYIAKSYISKFQCKGVVFYLSEHSILSPACNKEIEYVRKKGLNYFSINLPLEQDKATASGENMLLELLKNGKANASNINLEKSKELFAKAFNQDVIYLPYDAPTQAKYDSIKKTLQGRDLFEFKFSLENVNHRPNTPVAILTACKDNAITSVKIPSYVARNNISNLLDLESYENETGTYFEELPLTHLDDTAIFTNFHSLESAELPETLVSLGADTFRNCFSLEQVNLQELDNLTFIHDRAFEGCKNFVNVTLPEKVMILGAGCFKNCKKLRTIKCPESLRKIGDSAFENCTNLLSFPIPEQVRDIGNRAFAGCNAITQITLPKKILSLGDGAFAEAKNLKSVIMFDSMTELGSRVFFGCESLCDVTLSKYVQELPIGAFDGCVSLKHFDIPLSVTYIADRTFAGCKNLKNIIIPAGVERIFSDAFLGCVKLKSVTIPASVMEIRSPFTHCDSLTEISVEKDNPAYKSLHDCIYSMDGALIQYAVGKKDESFIIPDFVTEIESHAFGGAKNLKSITIPASVEKIWHFAFDDALGLETIVNNSSLKLDNDFGISKKVKII